MYDQRFFLLFAIILVAKAVEAITGFGSTIIALTLGAQIYPIEFLLPILVPLNIVLSTYIVVRHRSGIARAELGRRILPLAVVGLVAGMIVFDLVQGRALKLAYGIFVLCFAVMELAKSLRKGNAANGRPLSGFQSVLWLIAGGVMQGIYASGGPMVVYYASRKITDKGVFRSTLSALWLILNVFLLANYIYKGNMDREALQGFVSLLPAVAAGIFVGDTLHKHISEEKFRILVFILLIVAGASLALKA